MDALTSPLEPTLLKAALAALACGLTVLPRPWLARLGQRARRAGALLLATAAVALYFQPALSASGPPVHHWEMFHYYLGAKYAPELGYDGLYACVAVAEAEASPTGRIAPRPIRDLHTDRLVPVASALSDPGACKRRFEPARWEAFAADVGWFGRRAPSRRVWQRMQADHGYNPSPVWTIAGRALASLGPPSVPLLTALAGIDLLLMAGAIGALGWAFGWRIAVLAVVFWGTQAPAPFGWTGGALLRHDWLFGAALGMACLRRRHFFWAGAALAYAALLRVFPVLLFVGPLVVLGVMAARDRRAARSLARFAAGAAVTAALLLPLGALAAGGPGRYAGFAERTLVHARSTIVNHVSLRTLLEGAGWVEVRPEPDAAPSPWEAERLGRREVVRPIYALAMALAVGLLLAVSRRLRTPWLALGLSLSLVISLTDPSCYYYSAWILLAPLARARRSVETALLGVACIGNLLALQSPASDHTYVALSGLYVAATLAILLLFARPSWRRATDRKTTAVPRLSEET